MFGDVEAEDSDTVLRNWESIKLEERRARKEDLSVLAGVPAGLPPLLKAHRMQGKAAHVGFDWPGGDAAPLFAKLDEEADELWEAVEHGDAAAVEDELGNHFYFFDVVVNKNFVLINRIFYILNKKIFCKHMEEL